MGEYRKTFVNRIYTVGLTTCGSALVRIAGATESEGFQKVASFVNKWICGGNNTGQTLAEIQALCNEILNEVKIVDQHLKEYDAEIENTLQKIQYTEAKNELNQQWSKDIDVYETAGNVGNTLSAYEDYMKAAQLYMDGKTDINAVEKSKQKLYDNFIEVYKAAGNSFENPTDEKKKDAIFCNDTIDGVFKRSIWSMINALNKPSDEKNYADAAAQFAYRAYGFSGDQYNYIVSSIDKQFMEIIKMEMMYQEFIAQRGDYFEEKYPDDESKWESYAAWTNDLNKLNEDVAKAMDTMLDREILVSDSTVGSIRMKLDEFVKPEDMVSVRMKNENYHEKLTGEFYENEQPIIDAFNEGYLYLIEEYGWKSNADVITPFVNFHRIAVPTPKTEENPSGIDIYYIFDTSQPHDAEEDWAWNSDDSVPENLRFYQFEEKIDLTLARDQHIPSCDFINLTKENYSDGQNQFSCAKNTAEFQSLFATGLFSALSSIVGKLDKNGSIQIAYSAQTAIEGGTTGAVFGTKEETAGAVNNTYYLDTLSGNEEQGTAKTAAEMKSNAFKEELNTLVAGNEELCSWTWNSTKNQGYPRILSSLITEVELVNASRGLTVKGMMHKDTKLQLNELDKKNDIYQAFKKYAQKTDKQVLYSAEPTLVYEDGQPSAYEGNLNVKLDLSKYRGKGYKVLVYRNNQIEELEIDKQMIASKDVEEMVPFAVLAEKSELSKAVDHIKDTIKTGDNSSVILLLCIVVVAGSVAGGVIYWRKKKARK